MLHIQFLGTPIISNDNTMLVELTQAPVVLRLFAFLVTNRKQPQQRSTMAATFWPNVNEERARRNLTSVFWRLRNILPNADDFLIHDKQTIQFHIHSNEWLDTVTFDQATQNLARLSATAQQKGQISPDCLDEFENTFLLYRGEFLAGIDDEWCLIHRTHWHERYINILENFIGHCQMCGELKRALPQAQQLVRLEPYHENFQRCLIELYMALERPNEARTQFEQYEQLWRNELCLSVSVEMQNLANRIGLRRNLSPTTPYVPSINYFEQKRPAWTIELTPNIMISIDRLSRQPVQLTLMDYTELVRSTDEGPRSFPITGLADLPIAERQLVLSVLNSPPVNRWLDISTVQSLPDSPFTVTHLEPPPLALRNLVPVFA